VAVLPTIQIVRHTAIVMQIARHAHGVHAMTAHLAAMIAMLVQHVVTMNVSLALLVTAKIVQHVQVLVVASATATVQSVLHTASQIHLASKTALQSAVGQKIVVVTQVAIHLAKSAIPTVQTVQHAMIHANHHSAVHATQTQTRRLSSKTRFLSV
jgi:argonaute-like protein implicated in RNA metabolism and viral defense